MADTVLEDMVVRLLGDGGSYQRMIDEGIKGTNKFAGSVGAGTTKLEGLTAQLGTFGGAAQGIIGMLAGGLGIGGFLQTVFSAVNKAAEQESVEIAFRSLIGNAERAQTALGDLRQFAVETPFEVPQILNAAKMMLAYGQQAEELVPTMRKLGDVASGLNIPLNSLAYLYGTLKSSGRVMTMDMRQFANRGIPIWLYLAKAIGMVTAETTQLSGAQSAQLAQMVTKGQVNFQMIEKAFTLMTSKGGNFFNMMKDQSASFNGIISNLKDSLGLLLADVGKQIIEGLDLKRVLAEIREFAQAAADWFKNMDPGIKKTIFVIAAVVAGMGVLIAVILTVVGIVKVLGIAIAAVGWPFLIIIGLIVAAVAIWVNHVGGVGKALDIIKAKAIEFWNWLTPIRLALIAVFKAAWVVAVQVWDAIVATAISVWEIITGIWSNLFGDVQITWTGIRDFIVDSLLWIAYGLKHFQDVAGLAFTWAKLKAIDFFYTVMELSGPAGIALAAVTEELTGMRAAAAKDLEIEFARIKPGFDKFKKDALAVKPDDIIPPKTVKDMAKQGEEMGKKAGQAIKKGVQKEMQDLDSVLFGSAEAKRRWDTYIEAMNRPMNNPANVNMGNSGVMGNRGGIGNGRDGVVVMGDIGSSGGVPKIEIMSDDPDKPTDQTKITDYLKDIRNSLKEREAKPTIEVEGAEIETGAL